MDRNITNLTWTIARITHQAIIYIWHVQARRPVYKLYINNDIYSTEQDWLSIARVISKHANKRVYMAPLKLTNSYSKAVFIFIAGSSFECRAKTHIRHRSLVSACSAVSLLTRICSNYIDTERELRSENRSESSRVHFMWPDPTQPISWLTQPNPLYTSGKIWTQPDPTQY